MILFFEGAILRGKKKPIAALVRSSYGRTAPQASRELLNPRYSIIGRCAIRPLCEQHTHQFF
jgi:hypothetical protein